MRGRFDWDLKRFHERYGDVVRFSPDELSFTGEQAWRDIYGARDHSPLEKDPAWYDVARIADQATTIWTADRAEHDRLRRLLSPAFSDRALREQEPLIRRHVDLLMARLRELARQGAPVDLVQWFTFTTFDIIGDLALGKSFGCLRDGQYHRWVRDLFAGIKIGAFTRTMAAYTDVKRVMELLAPRALREARAQHEAYVADAARERVARGVLAERRDFLSYILPMLHAEADDVTDKQIAANCGFFLLAGSETTATALSGITYHLLKNPDARRRCVAEVRSAFAREDDINLASTGATALPYLQACISEGMRMYPPAPTLLPRRTPRGVVTKIAGYEVPGWVSVSYHININPKPLRSNRLTYLFRMCMQTAVGVHALSATRSPRNFHLPDSFIPDRWLPSSPSCFATDHRAACQPFSTGPRGCLGKSLAYHELRLILARLLWGFDLALCPESDQGKRWDAQRVYMLWEKGLLMCMLKIREDLRVGSRSEGEKEREKEEVSGGEGW